MEMRARTRRFEQTRFSAQPTGQDYSTRGFRTQAIHVKAAGVYPAPSAETGAPGRASSSETAPPPLCVRYGGTAVRSRPATGHPERAFRPGTAILFVLIIRPPP